MEELRNEILKMKLIKIQDKWALNSENEIKINKEFLTS